MGMNKLDFITFLIKRFMESLNGKQVVLLIVRLIINKALKTPC